MTAIWAIVVHYGDVEPTRRCLASLAAGARVPDGVVVVDNDGGFEPSPGPEVDVLAPATTPGSPSASRSGRSTRSRAARTCSGS